VTLDSPMKSDRSIAVTSNDDRARFLVEALGRQSQVVADVPFDRIDKLTRYAAAALSFRPNRAEWWVTYQMHPLVERRRRRVLQQGLRPFLGRIDGLVMWGSWFHPRLRDIHPGARYINYIDQSLALEPVLGEPKEGYIDRRVAHRLQAETYRDSAAVMCMSQWAREQTLLAHPALPPEKVRVAGWGPCGIDLSATPLPWSEREPLVLHVSNDFHRKGLDYLIETAARVRQSVPGARFVVIGSDYGRMPNPPTGEGVTFTGRISDRAVLADYFRRASVFFLPHRFDRSPHVLVEAMSAGIPLVASAQGGALELIEGTGAGFAVPIGDVAGYAKAILTLLTSPETAADMGQRGRRLMLRSYTWDAVAARLLDAVVSRPAGLSRAAVATR
jgi:glycosyltransferase involved in cell wall biosynthesis